MAALDNAKPITSYGSLDYPTWSPDVGLCIPASRWEHLDDGVGWKQPEAVDLERWRNFPLGFTRRHYIVFLQTAREFSDLEDGQRRQQPQEIDLAWRFSLDCSPDGKWVVYLRRREFGRFPWKAAILFA